MGSRSWFYILNSQEITGINEESHLQTAGGKVGQAASIGLLRANCGKPTLTSF